MHVSRTAVASTILPLLLLAPSPVSGCAGALSHSVARRDGQNSTQQTNSTSSLPAPVIRIQPQPARGKTALVNVRVFDGYAIQPASTVYIDADTIVADSADVDQIIDGQGGILLPGLIDSHAHPATLSDLEAFSSWGVTTVLNMACNDYTSCASLRDQRGLTSYFSAGWNAVGPGSAHANAQQLPPDRLINSTTQVSAWVDAVFTNGSDFLKITAELNGPDQATQNALVLETHARGFQSMTHASDITSYTTAILSRSDGLQHIPADGQLNTSLITQMHAQQQFATPTLYVFRQLLPTEFSRLDPGAAITNSTAAYDFCESNVLALHEAGIPILAGTDSIGAAGIPGYPFSLPFGSSLHDELVNLVDAGLAPAEALRAATVVPAMAHHLKGRGVVAAGYRADLVLLKPDADPLRNVSDTRMVARVWNEGLEYGDVQAS